MLCEGTPCYIHPPASRTLGVPTVIRRFWCSLETGGRGVVVDHWAIRNLLGGGGGGGLLSPRMVGGGGGGGLPSPRANFVCLYPMLMGGKKF